MRRVRPFAALAVGLLTMPVLAGTGHALVSEDNFISRTTGDLATLALVQILSLPILGRSDEQKAVRWPGSWVCCAKNVFYEHGAVPEMKEGPSEPACRSRLQTAVSCFGPKGRGGERYGQKA